MTPQWPKEVGKKPVVEPWPSSVQPPVLIIQHCTKDRSQLVNASGAPSSGTCRHCNVVCDIWQGAIHLCRARLTANIRRAHADATFIG